MYDINWARSVVARWWKLCTRTQLLAQHYEQTLAIYYPQMALQLNESLFEDLSILLARTKTDKGAAALWTWYKKFGSNMHVAISSYDKAKTALKYARIRIIARRGFRFYVQQEFFERN